MTVSELMKVLNDGTACFTIRPYCEEYSGLYDLKREPWYSKIQNRQVKQITTIGGGSYRVEMCIELEG